MNYYTAKMTTQKIVLANHIALQIESFYNKIFNYLEEIHILILILCLY